MSHPVEIDPILLSKVSKPARYVGGEWNSVVKDHDAVKLTVAYCFPDVYEVAMSHLGLRILYALLNERPDVAAERVYAPWPDMEEVMRSQGYPLFSLETKTPVRDFDMVGFTLQYEMSFTNILNMLDLAGIPLFAKDRGDDMPLVAALCLQRRTPGRLHRRLFPGRIGRIDAGPGRYDHRLERAGKTGRQEGPLEAALPAAGQLRAVLL